MRAATSASSSTPSTTPSASTPPSATARLLSSRQTSRYPKPHHTTMINTLSQKLPCLTYGVQSSALNSTHSADDRGRRHGQVGPCGRMAANPRYVNLVHCHRNSELGSLLQR